MSNLSTAISRGAASLAILLAAILPTSCRKDAPKSVDPIAHNAYYDIWPDSIDLHDGVVLRAMSDSLMEVRVSGNVLDSITAGAIPPGRMTFRSTHPLLDFLYRLEASTPASGRYSAVTPYEIFLNPTQNDSAMAVLEGWLRNGVVIPWETRTLGWPTVNSNAEWLLAASELGVATGDQRWIRTVNQTAKAVIASDNRIARNPATGLFIGIPRYMAASRGIFPEWMEPSDIFQQSTLAVNMAYAASMKNLGMPTDSLIGALKDLMWIPNMGYFSATAYGVAVYPLPLQVTDNLAQSVAILSGVLPDAMADAIIRKTPIGPAGISLYQPALPPASGELKEEIPATLLQTAWTAAAASRGNEAAYSTAVGELLAIEGKRLLGFRHQLPTFRSTFTTFITRALLGMKYTDDGVFFIPYVPENLPGEKIVGNLRYRKAILDIKITGTGKAISTFTIDGKPSEPFFPASLEGRHKISITLAGAAADPGYVTVSEQQMPVPLPPVAEWKSLREATLHPGVLPTTLPRHTLTEDVATYLESGAGDCRLVYINGVLQEEIFRSSYRLYDAQKLAVVQFTAFANSELSGFSSKPYLYLPPSKRHTIYASSLAKTGTKVLEDKSVASKFVESNRFKNRTVSFDFEAPQEGRYLVEVHYANGLGVVNGQRKVALRILRANGSEAGIFVFPQLTAANAQKGEKTSWQEMTAWSNSLIVKLRKGTNHLELRYYQPSPVYADPNSNVVLFDLVRLTPVD